MKARFAVLILLSFALAFLPSCGFFGPDDTNSGGGNGGGGGTPPGTGVPPKFAYVANFNGSSVSGFTVSSSNGALTSVLGSPFSNGALGRPSALATDSGANVLFVADQAALAVVSFPINRNDGTLPQVSDAKPAGTQPTSLVVSPNGTFLYVVDHSTAAFFTYQIGALGTLNLLLTPAQLDANPWTVAMSPNGKFLYVANDVAGTQVFTADATTGFLLQQSTMTMLNNGPARDVVVTPNSNFAYVINGGGGIEAYSIDQTNGNLTRIGTAAVATGTSPVKIAVDPTGKFLYVANSGSNNVSGYSINANGSLTPISGSPFAAGGSPSWVAADPSGLFLYVTNQSDSTVSIYSLNASGALTNTATPQVGAAPASIIITK